MISPVDWESSANSSFINSRLPKEQSESLLKLLNQVQGLFHGHVFLLSSGTTAQSPAALKWVALNKQAFLASALSVNQHLHCNESDLWLHTLPDFHVGGLGIWARSYLSKAPVIQLPHWDPESFVQAIGTHQATLTSLVPTQIYDLVTRKQVCPDVLRVALVGGGALAPSLFQKAVELGWPLLTTYGMTETCSQIATADLKSYTESHKPDISPMRILPHLQVENTEDGKLRIKGDSLLTAYIYWDDQSAFVDDPKLNEGWFYSEDRGIVMGDQLKVFGRTGDFLKIGGESVEISRLVHVFDKVRIQYDIRSDAALLPFPDERLGHVIYLISDNALASDQAEKLISEYNSQVLAFEKIRKWCPLKALPRTPLGKLIPSACIQSIESSISL